MRYPHKAFVAWGFLGSKKWWLLPACLLWCPESPARIHQFHVILLMEEILHQLIWWKSHYLQAFINPKWCRIFFHQQQDFRFRLISWKWSTQSTTPCAQKEERTTSWWFQFSSILPQELVRWFPIFRPVHLFSKKLAEQIIKLPRKVIFFPPGFSCP